MTTELKDGGGGSVGGKSSDMEGPDDKHVEPPLREDESPDAPQGDRTDRTFHLSQITHYSSTEDSSNEQRTERKLGLECSWTSLALAGFVATVVGALIALAIGHMRSHKQALSLGSNKLDGGPNYSSTTMHDDPGTWSDTGDSKDDAFNGTDQAIMFVLNVD
ncbi:uncharacterized protein LOC119462644 [Dermacentor silvarum]|uniref:uncharacterized protein LOC119462644 n=1 Tax=Dermacentor silvarum TaxID=543639 RepID=UPI001897A714|nr:uncharacterized protein LOC119462644 [Dermacentor silvarum]